MAKKLRKFQRKGKHFRTITILSTGLETRIDPSQYAAHTNLKEFDANSTQILRVHRSAPAGRLDTDPPAHFLIYGMRSAKGKIVKKAHEMVINADMIPAALDAVAKHCGIEDLRKQAA